MSQVNVNRRPIPKRVPATAPAGPSTAAPTPPQKPEKRKTSRASKVTIGLLIALVAILLALLGLQQCSAPTPKPQSGVEVVSADSLDDDAVRAMLDQKVRDSMMAVSVGQNFVLDGNDLEVIFTNKDTNKYAQRFTFSQDGAELFESDPIDPGFRITKLTLADEVVKKIHEGDAVVNISFVDENGQPFGNSSSVTIPVRFA